MCPDSGDNATPDPKLPVKPLEMSLRIRGGPVGVVVYPRFAKVLMIIELCLHLGRGFFWCILSLVRLELAG